jgi:hypothetical protein
MCNTRANHIRYYLPHHLFDRVGAAHRVARLMDDGDDRAAAVGEAVQAVYHKAGVRGREPGGGLVHEENLAPEQPLQLSWLRRTALALATRGEAP